MSKATKIRARFKDGLVEFRMLMLHEMETGRRKDVKTGDIIPAWFIKSFEIFLNSESILIGQLGPTVSKNPYFRCRFRGSVGDNIKVQWKDNLGNSRIDEGEVVG
ncbi:MAG: thiosulfate oxidation carrier complex protein SoxZ [Betaproteobacteria bacterium TMED82]|nr:MAG: thiosulfate oxidation carrier complex protein SoxZ [Betaproteobacteria bacterium TMED82]